MLNARFKTNACKKYRAENHIRADFHFLVYVRGILNGAEHNARYISSRNICNPKITFRCVGKEKTQRKT